MPLRVAIPVNVIKPIMLATESGCPASHNAATLPMSASGTLPIMMKVRTADRYRLNRMAKINARESADSAAIVRLASSWD